RACLAGERRGGRVPARAAVGDVGRGLVSLPPTRIPPAQGDPRMFSLSRRDFLKGSALLAAAAAGCNFLPEEAEVSTDPPVQANPAPRGANERLNVAVLGCRERGRGMDHINGFLNRDLNCTITPL